MSIHKFGENDVFVNTIVTKPHSKFVLYNKKVVYRAGFASSVPEGSTALFDLSGDVANCPPLPELGFDEKCNSQYIPVIE
jgi:hypothetical protein